MARRPGGQAARPGQARRPGRRPGCESSRDKNVRPAKAQELVIYIGACFAAAGQLGLQATQLLGAPLKKLVLHIGEGV